MNSRMLCGLLIGLMYGGVTCWSQYFEPAEYGPPQDRYITLGMVSHEFRPRSDNSTADSVQIAFERWAPTISYHQGPVDVQFAYTRYQLRGNSYSAIHFGTVVSAELPLLGRRPSALALPVCIAGDFTKASSDGAARDEFNVGSLGIGAGLQYRISGTDVDVAIRALGIAQFAFEGYGSGIGSSMVLLADARLLWRMPVVFDGLVFGYRFRSQTWAVGDGRLDYRSIMHGPYVGALF